MSQLMRLWYLSHRRPAKAQAKYGSRRRVRPKIRHLAPLYGCVWSKTLRRTKGIFSCKNMFCRTHSWRNPNPYCCFPTFVKVGIMYRSIYLQAPDVHRFIIGFAGKNLWSCICRWTTLRVHAGTLLEKCTESKICSKRKKPLHGTTVYKK